MSEPVTSGAVISEWLRQRVGEAASGGGSEWVSAAEMNEMNEGSAHHDLSCGEMINHGEPTPQK